VVDRGTAIDRGTADAIAGRPARPTTTDAWFVGYTPSTLTWVGYAKRRRSEDDRRRSRAADLGVWRSGLRDNGSRAKFRSRRASKREQSSR
jgi:membrane carboxypeptidase/penicillin-binding protein